MAVQTPNAPGLSATLTPNSLIRNVTLIWKSRGTVYRVTILFRVIVAESGCVTMKRVYSKNIPLSVARTEPEPLKIERFGKFKNKNVSNQTWKAWQTWFATVRSAYNKFYHLLQAWLTYHNGLRTRYSDWNPWLKRLKPRSRFVNHSKKNRKTLDSHRYVVLIGSFFVKTKNLTQSFSSVFLFRSWAWLNLQTKRSRTVLLLSNLEALNVKDRWR